MKTKIIKIKNVKKITHTPILGVGDYLFTLQENRIAQCRVKEVIIVQSSSSVSHRYSVYGDFKGEIPHSQAHISVIHLLQSLVDCIECEQEVGDPDYSLEIISPVN